MDDFAVRAATPNDLEALLPLVRAYRAFYGQTANDRAERAYMHAHLNAGTSVVYIAAAATQAAGFAQLFKSYSTVHLAPSWILEDLYVEPSFRGRGVASALLRQAVEHARGEGAAGMFLETASDNAAAQRVYERNGWTREGRFYKYNAPF